MAKFNLYSTIDDLLVFSAALPLSVLLSSAKLRVGLGASEICFSTPVRSWFFSRANIIPIVRGHGIYQPAMDRAIHMLDKNRWVHIFPEGKVNPSDSSLLPFRWGVSRLIMDAQVPPLLVPIFHRGCHEILPLGKPYIPKIGKTVRASSSFAYLSTTYVCTAPHSLWRSDRYSSSAGQGAESQ